ncbi:Thermophilic serine proteinase precursor [Luteitalea pratensis]|uniref:Thermophilic serine proteinase n=2 Tax=Luteitalea pratensis TaxID=1855912 RepID=A0A143PSE2_LUTPR|nr:Thermophilic serine proteinase precursor [Luteitalea pratensis]
MVAIQAHTGKRLSMRRSVILMGLVLVTALSLVLAAQEPAFTRSPRADIAVRLRAAARLGTDYVPGRVLVKFRAGLPTQAQASAVTQALPGTATALRAGDVYTDFAYVDVPLDADVPTLAAALAARPEVEYAEPDAIHHLEVTPSDPSFGRQWNMRAMNLERAWDINDGAHDVVVAVIDSGLAMANDVLRFPRFFNGRLQIVDVPFARSTDIVSSNRLVAPYDFFYEDDLPYDMDGHGTHVTGTVGQLANAESGVGVAYSARIMPLKVCLGEWEVLFLLAEDGVSTLPPTFQGGVCFTSDESRAIRYAADNGAKVINISIGGESPAAATQSALQYAVSRGAFVALSGGNDFEEGNQPGYPALYAKDINGVMAVAAVGQDLNHAYYSTTGDFIEIAAPGGNTRVGGAAGRIWQQTYRPASISLNQLAPRFDLLEDDAYQGTSMASPHVAGLAALLQSQGIRSPAAIEAAIRQFANDRGTAGRDNEYGFGVVDARATLRGLGIAK